MVHRSLSLLSSTSPSSIPSNFNSDSSSPSSFILRRIHRFPKLNVSSRQLLIDNNDSPEQFQQNNSIADFMRFRKGTSSDDSVSTAELQTAVVTYRKKFPWSFLQPFLKVKIHSLLCVLY